MSTVYLHTHRVVQYEKLTLNPLKEMDAIIEFIDPQRKYVQRDLLEKYVWTHTNSSEKNLTRLFTTVR